MVFLVGIEVKGGPPLRSGPAIALTGYKIGQFKLNISVSSVVNEKCRLNP